MLELPGEKWGFLIITMVVILILGFFIDFVEICFIIV
ncbi:TRAP transporter large permease subunit, partial [Salmonella enterica subsp. enterica serovar Indiana]|nr:TRAP transporter large permease subunit [Salmonella enterica subsp. enterica serovar Indiana]